MTEAPSADTSLASDGSSARGARRRGGSAKPAVSELLRLMHRVALAVVTIVVCAVVAGPARGNVSLLAGALDATVADGVNAGRGVLTSEPLQYWQDEHGERRTDLKAVEFDGDDEDDPLWHVAENAALSFRRVPAPPKLSRVLRGELQIDTSRFAAGTGLPRGPPV